MAFDFLPDGLDLNAIDGTCYGCGDPHRNSTPAFRAPRMEDFIGQVEVCARCVREMAAALGLVPGERHVAVKATNQRLLAEKDELLAEIETLHNAHTFTTVAREKEFARLTALIEKTRVKAIQDTEARLARTKR